MATTSTRKKKKVKRKVPKGYDSTFEYDLHINELKDWDYHPKEKVQYVSEHSYEPDFKTEICLSKDRKHPKDGCCNSCKTILVEVKGRFRDRKEATKYLDIRKALASEGYQDREAEIIFIFYDANKPMPFAAKRKDGTKQTHGEWAEKNEFRYYCAKKGLPKTWQL